MSLIIQVLATYAPWIYAACGLVALYQIYRILLVRAERRHLTGELLFQFLQAAGHFAPL